MVAAARGGGGLGVSMAGREARPHQADNGCQVPAPRKQTVPTCTTPAPCLNSPQQLLERKLRAALMHSVPGCRAYLKPPGRYQFDEPPPVPQLSISNSPASPALSTTFLNTASAEGLRQMLPRHTNSTLVLPAVHEAAECHGQPMANVQPFMAASDHL